MIFDNILGLLSVDMGIDLGTANTLVCVEGEGIVLNEPSVVAVRKGTNRVLDGAIGVAAKEMLGKTPGNIVAIRPLKDGVIADFDITQAMLSYFIKKVQKRSYLYKPRVVIAVPSGITAVEKRAVVNSAERAGSRKVFLIEEPIAAGMGLGLPIMDPFGSMVVDVGGGTTEVAVISLGGIVTSESIRIAGDDMDDALIQYCKRTYNLLIGVLTAERLKIEVGSAFPLDEERIVTVKGRDLMAGLPRKIDISSEEIREALRDPVGAIIEAIKMTLERTAPELAADLVDRGLTLCGGGALLRGLDKVIAQETGLSVTVDSDPLTAVARGTGVFLENLDRYSKAIESEEDEG